MWVDTVVVHFTGAAALWLEWSKMHLKAANWEAFCAAVLEKFGRSEFQHLLRRFSKLKQEGSVLEYAEQFNVAMHCLLAHHSSWDPLFFTTQFIEGLAHEIKVAVMLHRPKDLDTAVSLAELQEEVVDMVRQEQEANVAQRSGASSSRTGRFSSRPALSVAVPATASIGRPNTSKPISTTLETRRGLDIAKPSSSPTHTTTDDKLKALRAFRKARGLYFTCGERWGPGHVCASTVQLHVVEELVGMISPPASPSTAVIQAESSEDDLCLLSAAAVQGTEAPKAFRLSGKIGNKALLMLLDSGSSHSFVNTETAQDWEGVQAMRVPLKVKVADGAVTLCDQEVPDCEYVIQGHRFSSTLKLFPLGSYDIVLGMDWLESRGLMTVNWGEKLMTFQHKGAYIQLTGTTPEMSCCRAITGAELQLMHARTELAHVLLLAISKLEGASDPIPIEVEELLTEFTDLFEEPKGLPPQREFDHAIELIPGAQPVKHRPYRYNPAQKDEIEAQVAEMLKQGIIQLSRSPFSSRVLLVQKKDGEWRFCVDYRFLNAITIKNRYPIPVIDELLDELHGATVFTSLDLRSGYHQIRMRPEDEAKTAFQTHHGHFKFKVMPYGVTGGPPTFQGGMHVVLSPFLRK